MEKVNKKQLAEVLAEKNGLTKKDAVAILDTLVEEIVKNVKEDKAVDISGLGKFYAKHHEARKGINPRTKEKVDIEAKSTPAFKPAKGFKEAL
ncbi:MAG: HU family DNA-binding protein [Erysipelotrichales bacterium]|nr:HU family DNA-binding protein [Erysipelotrichales bacterium]MBQ2309303.1 HU family DNA-binding protein [Erysipelotrichales bacterium]MBQ2478062.1 HU family DNA-binding protein [Erysipelotrichales bacterium]MBQ5542383.1 HU family DNA-binding protein [Erysipelotrichales bacterium]